MIVPGKDGATDFEALMQRFQSRKSNRNIQFCVFDIFYLKGERVPGLPLHERENLLSELNFDQKRMITVQWIKVTD
ncbi:ATP-dependent DNA ligase [Mesobacillus zeae]|uniref:ATP-dependent DNA ligase n=1 Tax=Mesobacillus zeae TaxID=1917180 RepID=UPI001FE4DCCF|nr:hypothetical protein [Mesobacillus zeae]